MAKRICHLSEQEVSAFRRRERASHDAAEVRRLQAVRLYGSRKPVSEIADVTGCVESSLRRWVGRYQQQGLDGLKGQYEGSSHNPSKLTAAQRVEIQERLHRYRPDQVLSPAVRVSHGQFWTVSDLHLALEAWYA